MGCGGGTWGAGKGAARGPRAPGEEGSDLTGRAREGAPGEKEEEEEDEEGEEGVREHSLQLCWGRPDCGGASATGCREGVGALVAVVRTAAPQQLSGPRLVDLRSQIAGREGREARQEGMRGIRFV